jgi:hypothetical protein
MKKMKITNFLLVLLLIAGLSSCTSEPQTIFETITITETVTVTTTVPVTTPETETVGAGGIYYIDDAVTWTNDRIWLMNGKVVVRTGGSLTIEAGTIIKSENAQGVDATALIVANGARIIANGTAESPIIFTDINDNIDYNDGIISPNRVPTDTGKWGGIIVLGNATVGQDGGTDDIEGIAAGFEWTSYGGDDDSDSSGSMSYISIRHSGTQLAGGDEIQGLTLGGVGSGTTVNHIEIVGSNDDGIEIFGGSVNVDNVVIFGQRDDALDIDQGYNGTITNAVLALRANSDNPFEIDGTEDSTGSIDGVFTINNVTVYGDDEPEPGKNNLGDWKSDATGLTNNVVYKNIDGLTIKNIDADTYEGQASAASLGNLNFNNFDFITATPLTDIFANTAVTDFSNWAEIVTEQQANTGADETVFSWTLWNVLSN